MTAPTDDEPRFSDYLDGAMSPEERAAFERELVASSELRAQFLAFRSTLEALSGLHKMSAPDDFERGVAETIRRRSAGRFFGRRAFGDRIPLELIALIVLAALVSGFLALRYAGGPDEPSRAAPAPATQEVMPKP